MKNNIEKMADLIRNTFNSGIYFGDKHMNGILQYMIDYGVFLMQKDSKDATRNQFQRIDHVKQAAALAKRELTRDMPCIGNTDSDLIWESLKPLLFKVQTLLNVFAQAELKYTEFNLCGKVSKPSFFLSKTQNEQNTH